MSLFQPGLTGGVFHPSDNFCDPATTGPCLPCSVMTEQFIDSCHFASSVLLYRSESSHHAGYDLTTALEWILVSSWHAAAGLGVQVR